MKRYKLLFLLLSLVWLGVQAQDAHFIFPDSVMGDNAIKKKPKIAEVDSLSLDSLHAPSIYAWKIDGRTGSRTFVDRDTLLYNFHQSSLMDGKDVWVGYLANVGSPAISSVYFDRREKNQFTFLDPFSYYYKTAEDHYFINTKQPYSNVYYQTGGGKQSKEERFKAEMSINSGKKFNFGFDIDYIYSRGFYSFLSNKQVNYDLYGSYIGERLEAHLFFANNYYVNSENGGIVNDASLSQTPSIPSMDIPVMMESVWNRLRGRQLYGTMKYHLGYNKEETTDFVPVASLIYTANYTDQRRRFVTNANSRIVSDAILSDTTFYSSPANDEAAYWSFKNTFAIAMNEGFRDWVKFGLKVFVEQDFRRYIMPNESNPIPNDVHVPGLDGAGNPFYSRFSQNSTVIGGVLSKEKGQFLKYNLSGDIGVVGYNLGEFNLLADISTAIPIAGKRATVRAKGYIKNVKPKFYENNYSSKYYRWSEDFSDTRRVFVGGEIDIPHTGTKLSGGVENVKNLIYYDNRGFISQSNANVQILAVRLEQKLSAGAFHWDNQLVFQTSSKEDVLPLPKFSVYSNIYLLTKVAKVLSVQLGVDAHYHTEYYAPGYNPLTLQFYNQQEVKIGNFPITTVYANLHLKKTRIFAMLYNVTGSMGDSKYFSVPHYPVNPMIFKFGLSWDFTN